MLPITEQGQKFPVLLSLPAIGSTNIIDNADDETVDIDLDTETTELVEDSIEDELTILEMLPHAGSNETIEEQASPQERWKTQI